MKIKRRKEDHWKMVLHPRKMSNLPQKHPQLNQNQQIEEIQLHQVYYIIISKVYLLVTNLWVTALSSFMPGHRKNQSSMNSIDDFNRKQSMVQTSIPLPDHFQ